MNLSDYLRQALQADDTQHIPDRRRYRTPMWGFTRRAKAHVDLAKLNGVDAFSAVDRCFRSWSDFVQVSDIWEDLFPDSDDPREEFIYTWGRIKWSRNELDRAQADAALLPLKPTLCFSP